MYTKKLSESRAISIVMRILALAVAAEIAFVVFGAVAGVVVLALGLALGLLLELRPNRDDVHQLKDAAVEGGSHSGKHVLVVANVPLEGEELARELKGRGVIDVLAPPLPSRTHLAVSDVDRELADAKSRLAKSLAWAHVHGLHARGEVGDPSTFTGIADELRGFGADEVFVVFRAGETRAAGKEIERLQDDLSVPVRVVAV